MAAVESDHWWYRSLHERVLGQIAATFPAREDLAFLDVGCGTGGLLQRIAERYPSARVRGIDIAKQAVRIARQRGFAAEEGDLREGPQKLAAETFDAIVLNDVNYFVPLEEWPRLLNEYAHLLSRGGIIILNVPAFPAFRGMHDLAVGIVYRMRPSEVRCLYDASRFERIETRCWPFVLSPLIWAIRLKQRLFLARGARREIQSDVALPSKPLNALFLALTRFESRIHAKLARWGSSLFIVLRRVETNR